MDFVLYVRGTPKFHSESLDSIDVKNIQVTTTMEEGTSPEPDFRMLELSVDKNLSPRGFRVPTSVRFDE